jgi:hypothetical protein
MIFRRTASAVSVPVREIPGRVRPTERTHQPDHSDSEAAAGLDITQIAQEVSRLIARQLRVGLERRGIGKWL